jgi:DNA-binding MarR family transcriptional regulator
MKAKGMYAYLFSKPGDWDFSSVRIAKEIQEGRKSILSMIKELEKEGLLIRKKLSNGRIEYYITYSENTQSPKTALRQNGTEAKRHCAERATISNKDTSTKKDDDTKKEETPAPKTQTILFFEGIIQKELPEEVKETLNWLMQTSGVPKQDVWREVQKFVLYWTEPTQNGKKKRWELETTYDVRRRLLTWFARAFTTAKNNIKNNKPKFI